MWDQGSTRAGRPADKQEVIGRKLVLTLGVVACLTSCDVVLASKEAATDIPASEQAADREAQVRLQNVLITAQTLFTLNQSFDGATPAALAATDPSVCYVSSLTASVTAGASCEGGQGATSVSVLGQGTTFSAAAMSTSGNCFWVRDQNGATTYGSGQPCTAQAAMGAASTSFPAP
jgi:hypothetical protein